MDVWQVLLLALVQGVTEFLPVSSSAHLILANQLFGWADQGLAMDVAVHVGSLLAVIGYFRRDLLAMLGPGAAPGFPGLPGRTLAVWLVAITLPLIIAGALFADFIGTHLRRVEVIAWASIVFGVLLYLADRWAKKRLDARSDQPQPRSMVAMGLAQVLALIPGTSRSGVTITAGLAAGMTRQAASRFAFLMAIPALGAAGAYSAMELIQAGAATNWGRVGLAVVASAIGAWACIGIFLKLVERIGMTPFVIYRIALGVILLSLI
ncbi:MAG: undecaprenyl-diphosphate phosphatase [Pseudomonadota bacterium]